MNHPSSTSLAVHAPGVSMLVPALVAQAGDDAGRLTLEFFVARVANAHTRRDYAHAVAHFCAWCQRQGVRLDELVARSSTTPRHTLHRENGGRIEDAAQLA